MKKYPREYYATDRECSIARYRKASIKIANRAGIFGWRSWISKANALDTVKPRA